MVGINILLTVIVGSALGFAVWKNPPTAWTAVPVAGLCLLAVGFVLWTTARFQLGNSLRVTAQARQLVTRGLYSRIRNPIYFFGSFVIVGLILVLEHPMWLSVFLILIPLQIWRGRREAAVLEAAFGEQYRNYRAETWF